MVRITLFDGIDFQKCVTEEYPQMFQRYKYFDKLSDDFNLTNLEIYDKICSTVNGVILDTFYIKQPNVWETYIKIVLYFFY